MGALVLVLWALLMSAECAGSPTGPGENLSCYQCFKVPSQAFCTPTACASTDRVCVSNAVIFTLRLGVKILLSKRCAPRCPNTNMKFEWLSGPGLLGQIIRQCCLGSLCNGAPTPQESPWALPRGLLLQMGLGLLRALL
ncbi:lymphocyte antigen 6L [Camelus dromedarius]|uniref:lymphocyte antigen 6L n=1 Tax=Camelus dromedarius TaxID=9838 RepID=UPI001263971F|nr:lymphocyte antigen 6L [Camelus dromedarius]